MFETEDGSKDEWRGMVLARAPVMNTWFYITYEKDPVLYMYQLLDDYKEGDLRIMPDSSKYISAAFSVSNSKGIGILRSLVVYADILLTFGYMILLAIEHKGIMDFTL